MVSCRSSLLPSRLPLPLSSLRHLGVSRASGRPGSCSVQGWHLRPSLAFKRGPCAPQRGGWTPPGRPRARLPPAHFPHLPGQWHQEAVSTFHASREAPRGQGLVLEHASTPVLPGHPACPLSPPSFTRLAAPAGPPPTRWFSSSPAPAPGAATGQKPVLGGPCGPVLTCGSPSPCGTSRQAGKPREPPQQPWHRGRVLLPQL